MVASKNVEFVNFLKKFEKDISTIPYKCCTPTFYPINVYLSDLFEKHINLQKITTEEIDNMFREIAKHTTNHEVRNLIVSKLIFELKYNSEDYNSQVIGQRVINNHLFKIH